eukprot:7940372-Pyramimonas_sp.AAC.3
MRLYNLGCTDLSPNSICSVNTVGCLHQCQPDTSTRRHRSWDRDRGKKARNTAHPEDGAGRSQCPNILQAWATNGGGDLAHDPGVRPGGRGPQGLLHDEHDRDGRVLPAAGGVLRAGRGGGAPGAHQAAAHARAALGGAHLRLQHQGPQRPPAPHRAPRRRASP